MKCHELGGKEIWGRIDREATEKLAFSVCLALQLHSTTLLVLALWDCCTEPHHFIPRKYIVRTCFFIV